MSRGAEQETEAVNADSFLDIVASVVSVMIIMVMMTGLKIKNTPVDVAAMPEHVQATADLNRELSGERAMRGDVLRLASQIQSVGREVLVREQERDMLALAVTSLEQKVHDREAADQQPHPGPGSDSAGAPAIAGRLLEARNRLEQLEYQCKAVAMAPAPAVQVANYPTPLGRTVDGREVHFHLRHGRIAYVPLEELMQKALADVKRNVERLVDRSELKNTLAPEGGFRLKYVWKLPEAGSEEARSAGRGVSFLDRATLIPVAEDVGETIQEALTPTSQFRLMLADRRAKDATITIWVYPDSFDAFRTIKQELYRLGFPVAARPLPEDVPITVSPHGTKSTAE